MLLVTGGAGFIGANFVLSTLAATGEPIVNLDKLTYAGRRENLESVAGDQRHEFVQGDVCDRALVRQLLAGRRPRAIVHFAAESHVDRSIEGPAEFIQTNVVGTFSLLEEARGFWGGLAGNEKAGFRFLQVSTDEVYGSLAADAPAFTEEHPYEPNSPYAASKAAADHLVRAYHHTYGLPVLTTNCSNNYGPRQFPEKLIPLMITQALAGKPLPVYGDGQNVRDWIHVEDHCRGLVAALEQGKPGQVYNFGASSERRNLEIVRAVLRLVGKPESLIQYVKDRPGHDRRYAIDAAKAQRELGWAPRHVFEEALAQTVQWYREHRGWWERIRTGEYLHYYEKQYGGRA
jgi:dTDP-glucose 4,6-dehydratase